MAKSKRAHSRHQANKSYPKPAAAILNTPGNLKHHSRKNVVDKPSQSCSELPLNSDPYLDEDDDLGTMDVASLHLATDVVKPKSKGADYRYLISEARSQIHSTNCMDVYSSLDDILKHGTFVISFQSVCAKNFVVALALTIIFVCRYESGFWRYALC